VSDSTGPIVRSLRRWLGWLPPVAFVAVLSLPLAQQQFGFAPVIGLGGVVDQGPSEVPVTLASWHGGDLQAGIERRIDQQLGLRDWMVRIDNQLKFSLFGVTKRPVVGGPGGWLVEDGYLTSRTHLWGQQGAQILFLAFQFLQAQAVLREHGVTLLLLVSPSKAETLPEHLPLAYRLVDAANHRRHLDLLRGVFERVALNHLDAQALCEQWRDQEPEFPVFPRAGTHWSRIAASRVAVRLLDELERLAGVDLVNLDLGPSAMGKGPGPSEDDMAVLANLLDRTALADPMPIPNPQRRPGDAGTPPSVLLVSSSFAWLLADAICDPAVTSRLTLFYYFKSAYDWIDGKRGEKRPIDFDPAALRAEILRHRFVVVECNAARIPELGFGFPAAVVELFGPPAAGSMPELTPAVLAELNALAAPGRRE
jgi:hypothetical protein